ncbi:MAG: cytidylate kinase family protein [Spirochaetota bacterium]
MGPEDYRVKLVAEKQQITEHEARSLIHKRERERIGFHRFFFDANWNDESCYDVILNIGAYNFQNILETALNTPFSDERIAMRKKDLQCLIQGEELYMYLLFEQKLFVDLLKIQFDIEGKHIMLEGIVADSKIQEKTYEYTSAKYPDYTIDVNFDLVQSSYLYFPSV